MLFFFGEQLQQQRPERDPGVDDANDPKAHVQQAAEECEGHSHTVANARKIAGALRKNNNR